LQLGDVNWIIEVRLTKGTLFRKEFGKQHKVNQILRYQDAPIYCVRCPRHSHWTNTLCYVVLNTKFHTNFRRTRRGGQKYKCQWSGTNWANKPLSPVTMHVYHYGVSTTRTDILIFWSVIA